MPTQGHSRPDEPPSAAVYVELLRDHFTAAQWTAHLSAELVDVDVDVAMLPAGDHAVVILTTNEATAPGALERATNSLIANPRNFGLVDAAPTRRAVD